MLLQWRPHRSTNLEINATMSRVYRRYNYKGTIIIGHLCILQRRPSHRLSLCCLIWTTLCVCVSNTACHTWTTATIHRVPAHNIKRVIYPHGKSLLAQQHCVAESFCLYSETRLVFYTGVDYSDLVVHLKSFYQVIKKVCVKLFWLLVCFRIIWIYVCAYKWEQIHFVFNKNKWKISEFF